MSKENPQSMKALREQALEHIQWSGGGVTAQDLAQTLGVGLGFCRSIIHTLATEGQVEGVRRGDQDFIQAVRNG